MGKTRISLQKRENFRSKLIKELSSKFPVALITDLICSYEDVVIEYRKGKWEETLWKCGKFAENVFRLLYFLVAGKEVSEVKNMREVKEKVEKCTSLPESVRILIPRITLSMIYTPRSKRGAVHIKEINPNFMDATLSVLACQWIMAEFLRLYHTSEEEKVAELINKLVQRKIPFIEVHGGEKFIIKPLGCKNEILLLLLDSPSGLTRREIGRVIGKYYGQSTITEALQDLEKDRFINRLENGKYIISGSGEQYIHEVLVKYL